MSWNREDAGLAFVNEYVVLGAEANKTPPFLAEAPDDLRTIGFDWRALCAHIGV
jgi:hypothetical protein